jgi:phosphoglycolate phosphatase
MKLALFDIDGTLVNSSAMIVAALRQAFAAEDMLAPPAAELLAAVGLSLDGVMRRLAPGRSDADYRRMAEAYKQAFWAFRTSGEHAEDLFDGAHNLLADLHRRGDVLLGIATGKSRRGVAHLLEAKGLSGWFATVQTSDDHPSKPHPSMIHQALAETGVKPHNTIMIGDTSFDMAMARAGHVKAIGVTWGNHPEAELRAAGAQAIVSDFSGLQAALDSLWQEVPHVA